MMRCPNVKRLTALFGLPVERARLIRKIAWAHGEGAPTLRALIEEHCPGTTAHAHACHGDPFDSDVWCTTMALEAIDEVAGTYGVEPLGPVDMHDGPPHEYLNVGDPYKPTLIYRRETDNLFVGCWGGIAEWHPSW